MDFVVNGFEPRELKEGTDVGNASGGHEDGSKVVKGGIGKAIEDMSNATHAEEPKFRW